MSQPSVACLTGTRSTDVRIAGVRSGNIRHRSSDTTLCHCMSTTKPACKHSACLDSMLLYEVQGSHISMHAVLEHMQQAGITYEMPAPYKLACTHCRETH